MSRTHLSLYELDRASLDAFGMDLRTLLAADDREGLVRFLGLGAEAANAVRVAPKAVHLVLAAESHPQAGSVLAAVRRAAATRALKLAWTSDALSLEGRLRGFEPIREDIELASLVDALLDGHGVPWFLRKYGGTFGILASAPRETLASGLAGLDEPPSEIKAFASALGEIEGDAFCHDTL